MFWNKKTIDGLVYIKSNGNWVLKPDIQKTYEEHKNHSSYYYNGNKIVLISPNIIDRVNLSNDDIKNNMGIFWGFHHDDKNGLLNIASQIDSIAKRIKNIPDNITIEEWLKSASLTQLQKACVKVYFDKPVPIRYRPPNKFEFAYDGRHRIIAARITKQKYIPVIIETKETL